METFKFDDNPHFEYRRARSFFRSLHSLQHLYVQNISLVSHTFDRLVKDFNGSGLKTLMVDRNLITEVYAGIHDALPELEILSMTENQLLSTTRYTSELLTLRHLRLLNLSRQDHVLSYPHKELKSRKRFRRYDRTTQLIDRPCFTNLHFACPIQLPQNLTYLDLSYSAFQLSTIPEIAMTNNNTLHFVNLAHNAIQTLPKPFYCPYNTKPLFQFLDLSFNKKECINGSYFTHCNWSSLNVLKLNQNRLGKTLMNDCDTNKTDFLMFIKPLWNLTKLDLSGNVLETDLKYTSFENQKHIEELYLSNMKMSNLTVQLNHMTKLRRLDLSFTSLQCLNEKSMGELNVLSSKTKSTLEVNLQNNPLQCDCQCYPFLKWLQSADIAFTGKDNLSCTLGKISYNFSDMDKIFVVLDEICFPRTWLHVTLGVQVTVFFLITFCTLVRRHKYRIYFFYLKCRISVLSRIIEEEVKPFHAFISYASQDRQWVKERLIKYLEKRRNLKLFVASRDFIAGKLITANIHSAITTSAKTVFVISKSFLKSEWCLEEFSMA